MKVKAFIKKLQKLDQDAEVVTYNSDYDFYSAPRIYKVQDFNHNHEDCWVSLEHKPEPKRILLIG